MNHTDIVPPRSLSEAPGPSAWAGSRITLLVLLAACRTPEVPAAVVEQAVVDHAVVEEVVAGPLELVSRDEVWSRRWKEKVTGVDIPVSLPTPRGGTPELRARLEQALTVEALVGESRQVAQDDGWVDRVRWEQTPPLAGLTSLHILIDGSGAWPSTRHRHLLVDLQEGRRVGAETFADPDAALRAVETELEQRLKGRPEGSRPAPPVARREHLDQLSADATGLTVHVDLGLPHGSAAGGPSGDVHLKSDVVLPWLQAESPLRRLWR